MLSAAPEHEPDGAWLSGQCTVLERHAVVNKTFRLILFRKLAAIWQRSDELVKLCFHIMHRTNTYLTLLYYFHSKYFFICLNWTREFTSICYILIVHCVSNDQ